MARKAFLMAVGALAGALLLTPAHAQSSSVRLQLGGEAAKSAATSSSQAGVRVWRGAAAPAELPLLGAEPKQASVCEQRVVVEVVHRRANHLRTQGFYSGLERKGWKFTQGFYSGQKTYR